MVDFNSRALPSASTQDKSRRSFLYGATVLLGAFLLFWIQPLLAKRLLPWFGGSAAVWSACILFFQAGLCVGYAYAHVNERYLPTKLRRNVHLALLIGACILCAAMLFDLWRPVDSQYPLVALLLYLTVTIGLPYLALSATGPLIQAWFAEQGPQKSPYRLYALSNIGALLALVGYLLAIDPVLSTRQQMWTWAACFLVFAMMFGWLTLGIAKYRQTVASKLKSARRGEADDPHSPSWLRRVLWFALPAFTSTILLATTNHVCQDVASLPLLWIVPLGLFLLSFILAFDHPRWYRRLLVSLLALFALYLAAGAYNPQLWSTARWVNDLYAWAFNQQLRTWNPQVGLLTQLGIQFSAMFLVCFVCHGELYKARPHSWFLTEYYLMIALGGAAGGVLVNFIAPLLFTSYLEWKITLVAGFLISMAVAFGLPAWNRDSFRPKFQYLGVLLAGGFVIASLGLLDMVQLLMPRNSPLQTVVDQSRNFYGVLKVVRRDGGDPETRDVALYHGHTIHGVQFQAPHQQDWPTTYYGEESGAGRAWTYLRNRPGLRVGIIGMGIGTLATYAQPTHSIRFYEINPDIVRIAESHFTYLKRAREKGAKIEIVTGDARQRLEQELAVRPHKFDLLILDAFNSDSIPNHLLTKEAFAVYLDHLSEKGAIVAHVSNRYLNLAGVVMRIAEEFGLEPIYLESRAYHRRGTADSKWVVLTRDQDLHKMLHQFAASSTGISDSSIPIWTDDHHSLIGILR